MFSTIIPSLVLRAGLGGLSQAALFGHGAAALAGRKDGTGSGGALLIGVTSLKTSSSPLGSNATVACTKKGPSDLGEDETSFAKKFKEEQARYYSTTTKFSSEPETENDKYLVEKIAGLAERSIDLLLKVEAEFKTEEGSSLYKDLWGIGMGFLVIGDGCRQGRKPMGLLPMVAHDLEMLRRVVYSATNTPLPPTTAEFVLLAYAANYNDDTIAKLERLFDGVKTDIEELLFI